MVKLTTEERRKFAYEKLEELRHLLRKSVKDIMAGDLAEAVRVAMGIRVLIHEAGRSTPLLKQLTPNYLQMEILDWIPDKKEISSTGVESTEILDVPICVQIKPEGVFLHPELSLEDYAPSILGKWWNRSSLILPGLGGFSRKEIILGLANKEGGAHVDPDVDQRYQQLIENESLQVGWGGAVEPLRVSRLMAGQAGIEILDCLDRNFSAVK